MGELSRPATAKHGCSGSNLPMAFIVVAASFTINSIYGGVFGVSGLYLHSFLQAFGASKVTTAWVISLQGSFTYFSGLLSGPLISRFGTRKVAVGGSFCSSIGLFLSCFAPNIILLYVSFGILTGCGFGMLMISNGVCVQQHTKKRRALAAGLALCGSGVGVFILPQVTKWALEQYGWRGSLLFLSGILLNTLPCSLLLCAPNKPSYDEDLDPAMEKITVLEEAGNHQAEQNLRTNCRLYPNEGSNISLNTKGLQTVSISVSISKQNYNESYYGSRELPSVASSQQISRNYKSILQLIKDTMSPSMVKENKNTGLIPVMIMVIASWFFYFGGMPITYVFCAVKAMSIGLSAAEGALFLSVAGLGEISGRVLGSCIASCHDKLPLAIFLLNAIFSGASCALFGISSTYMQMMITVICFAVTVGFCCCVSTTVIRDLVGVDAYPLVVSYAYASGGIGNIICIQTLAFVWEKTNSIYIPFITSGVVLICSGLFMLGAYIVHLKALKNLNDDEEQQQQ